MKNRKFIYIKQSGVSALKIKVTNKLEIELKIAVISHQVRCINKIYSGWIKFQNFALYSSYLDMFLLLLRIYCNLFTNLYLNLLLHHNNIPFHILMGLIRSILYFLQLLLNCNLSLLEAKCINMNMNCYLFYFYIVLDYKIRNKNLLM